MCLQSNEENVVKMDTGLLTVRTTAGSTNGEKDERPDIGVRVYFIAKTIHSVVKRLLQLDNWGKHTIATKTVFLAARC